MNNFFKLKLNISILISILIIIIIASYTFLALSNFYTYKKIVAPELELTTERFHFFLNNEFRKEWMRLAAPNVLTDKESPLKTFHITVKQKDIESLNVDLPTSGKDHYVDAYMRVSDVNKNYKIKLRYRGDSNYHWLYKQKSLRIKLDNADVYDMSKGFDLVNPPSIRNYRDSINYDLSKKLGLISPKSIPSRVYINGKYMGVYLYLNQVDESMLRHQKRMPGSIYFGDGSPINQNGIADLWNNQVYWKKKASRNAEQKDNRDDINLFIKSINSDEKTFNDFVDTYLDKNKFFTFIALDRIFGSHHHDYIHNHKIYFDPYKGKFEPISWDLRFWLPYKYKDLSIYPLQLRLTNNPMYDAQIDKLVYTILRDDLIQNVTKSYNSIICNLEKDLKSDIYKDDAVPLKKISSHPISRPFDFKEVLKYKKIDMQVLEVRENFLVDLYNDTKVSYKINEISSTKKILTVVIDGNSPSEMIVSGALVNHIHDNNNILKINTILYSGRKIEEKSQHIFPTDIFSRKLYGTKMVKNFSMQYKFIIDANVTSQNIISNIRFKNYVTGQNIVPNKLHNDINLARVKLGVLEQNNTFRSSLSGRIKLTQTQIYNNDVIIEPGTTFIMDANTSIYFYGKVQAIGTKENPIKFMAKDPKKPWGLIAVQGKDTTGSKFEYVEIKNGSLDTHNLIHYTSPFNIHDMDWFEVRNCKIGSNFVGDDAMHIAYAKGVVDNCEFTNARSDGLDIDISDVNVTNNIFYKSGNDGLDIMTTTMNASNNIFIDSGDKGISVGEWSDANITDSLFLHTVIGLEIKDKSKVNAKNLIYVDAREKAINLYRKNKRYDTGGFLEAYNIYLLGNTKIKSDKLSDKKMNNKREHTLPDLKPYRWYKKIQDTSYKKFLDEVEIKYAK